MVNIEYKNLPMNLLFEDEAKSKEIDNILKEKTLKDIGFLKCADKTFRQFVCLYNNGQLSSEVCEEIMGIMQRWDGEKPVLLKDMYPYLLEDTWQLSMSSVSYMKVDVHCGQEWQFDVESVERVQKSGDDILINFYAYDNEQYEVLKLIDSRLCYQLRLKDNEDMLDIMKKVILEGTVDLKGYEL